MQPGQIYDIYFPFNPPAQGGKIRPALILNVQNGTALAIAIKITSSGPTGRFPNRIPIMYWRNANLDHLSYAEIDSQTPLNIRHTPPFRGNMHPRDFNKVLTEYVKLHSK